MDVVVLSGGASAVLYTVLANVEVEVPLPSGDALSVS